MQVGVCLCFCVYLCNFLLLANDVTLALLLEFNQLALKFRSTGCLWYSHACTRCWKIICMNTIQTLHISRTVYSFVCCLANWCHPFCLFMFCLWHCFKVLFVVVCFGAKKNTSLPCVSKLFKFSSLFYAFAFLSFI